MNRPADMDRQTRERKPRAALTDLVGIETLQKLQDRFTDLGRVSVCICTVDGDLITRPSWGSRFSELIGTSPRGSAVFAESVRACAVDCNCEVPAMCHEGMTCYASPISVEGVRLGVIVVGTRSPTPPPPVEVSAIADKYDLDLKELLETATDIDPYSGGTPQAIHRFADVLADMIAALYAQATRIDRQSADLNAVHGLADLLTGTLDLQEILDLTVRRVVKVMAVKACGIRLLNEETGELVIKAVHNLSDDYLRKGPVMLRDNAIDGAAFAGEAVYIEDAPTDPRTRYPDNARKEGIVSGLCVPMTYRGKTIGVIRVYTAVRHVFTNSEELLLRSIGSQAASAIINSRLYKEHTANERFQRQVETAGEIQRRMLPSGPPTHKHMQFGCVYAPTLQVGGDFYDFIELDGGELGVCIADVVGKGFPAALMMASVRSALRAHADVGYELDAIVADVNQHMCRETLDSEFATLFYGVVSPDGRSITYCNAGHPPPVILRGDDFIELTEGGLVIGVRPDAVYKHDTSELRPGDVLAMATDGVSEAMDFNGTAFGRHRFLSSIAKHRELDAPQLVKQILWDVRRFVGLAEQSDDTTIVVAKVL